MKYTIRSDNPPSFSLCENNPAKSILQNVLLIVSTRKGTVPMYRDFGIAQNFVDRPQAVAETLAVAEIREAIAEFEPRANLTDIRFEHDMTGKTAIILEVDV